jgi:hypothetical protein
MTILCHGKSAILEVIKTNSAWSVNPPEESLSDVNKFQFEVSSEGRRCS